jgi:hypothetical protein
VPYILGRTPTLPFHTNLLLGLITPSNSSAEQQAKGLPKILKPEGCGLGYSSFQEPAKKDIIFGRFVQLNSYFFEVISWKPTVSRPVRRRHIANICRIHSLYDLPPNETQIVLSEVAMDFMTFQMKYVVPLSSLIGTPRSR